MKIDNAIRLVIFLIILYYLDFIVLANIIIGTMIVSDIIILIKNKIKERRK